MKGNATWHWSLIVGLAILLLGLVHANLACAPTILDEQLAQPFSYIIPDCKSIKSFPNVEWEGQSTSPQGEYYKENGVVAYYWRGCCSKAPNLKDTILFMRIEQFQSEEKAHARMEKDRDWLLQNQLLRFVELESRRNLCQRGVGELHAYRIENWGSEMTEWDAIKKGKCKGGIVSWGIVFRIERYIGDYHISCENPLVMLDEYDSPFLWLDIDLHEVVVDAVDATIIPLRHQANEYTTR